MDPVRQMVPLAGRTLYTLGQQRGFDVLTVDPGRSVAVVLRVHSSGKLREVTRRDIEAGFALAQRLPRGTLGAKRLRDEQACQANPAYLATLLREIGAN